MSKPFDATLKALLEESPLDWPALAGKPAKAVELIDADIATVSGAADKVLRVRGTPDWILHIDFQAGRT
jgi:predicted transposase YdaD